MVSENNKAKTTSPCVNMFCWNPPSLVPTRSIIGMALISLSLSSLKLQNNFINKNIVVMSSKSLFVQLGIHEKRSTPNHMRPA